MNLSRVINLIFLEIFSKVAKRIAHENLLKTYFTAGVTPEFTENPRDADALKGELESFYFVCLNITN